MKQTRNYPFWRLVASCLTIVVCNSFSSYAGTFTTIYNTLQTNCTGACHTAGSPDGNLVLTGSETAMFNALVGVTPDNAAAAARGDKLVDPGYPYRSFLLRKINSNPNELECLLETGEGDVMPPAPAATLTNIEMEFVRQWIFAGAPQNSTVVDPGVISDYYNDGGISTPRHPAPAASQGFQIRLGPILVDSFDEVEYAIKYDTRLPVNTEINRIETVMNDFSHHFIMYKFNDAATASSLPDGLRDVANFDNPLVVGGNEIVAVWQFSDDIDLPDYTAYFWDANTILDLNYHLPNYSGLGVLAADAYINVYTQPSGTALGEMKSELLIKPFIFIPPGVTDVETATVTNGPQWNIWMMTSHTHKYGTDFDVYLKAPGGGKGTQIFEGSPLGFYDWSHPPVEFFSPFLELPAGAGLVHEAEYFNYSSSPVTFGVTTEDEMMITIIQYTEGAPIVPPTGVPVQCQLFLEGAYNSGTGLMSTALLDNDLLPLAQPFNRPPWSYNGSESVATLADLPANTVDWLLLEVRDAANNDMVVEERAAFLRNDGIVIDTDGSVGVTFSSLTSGSDYYISVKTRHHLAVISSNMVQLPNATAYDFTDPANISGGMDQVTDLGGFYGLLAGDFNSDGILTVSDFNLYSTQASLINQYVDADCNVDRSVTVADFNLYQPNSSIIGASQIRY